MAEQYYDQQQRLHVPGRPQNTEEAVISCNCCRLRKLRCSRELPTCQQCRKVGSQCEYRREKMKPGIRPGAIESLHQRVGKVEEFMEELKATGNRLPQESNESTVQSVMAILAREICRLNDGRPASSSGPVQHVREPVQEAQRKRRRLDATDTATQFGDMPPLPPTPVLNQVLDCYFSRLHPWIPMLQENRFKKRLNDPVVKPKLFIILQAMIVSTIRYIDSPDLRAMTVQELEARQNWVVVHAMSSLVVESLQALTIIAFSNIGNGRAMRMWSIVGSLTRTIEYLQLTVEREQLNQPQPLSQPYLANSLRRDNISWIELEEQRRVFWVIFNLDRFCSITTGWNTSLTSDDVCRRLPCDITLWWQDEHVITPYFNIWDKSAGRIGNPIAFLPSHYKPKPADDMENSNHTKTSSSSNSGVPRRQSIEICNVGSSPAFSDQQSDSLIDKSTIGAFACSVEATESLCQITTYFLQQRVDMRNEREVESWLTRFKELDLRLIHWKMLLPQKLKPNMGHRPSGRMDPNLTLAHVSHNASIVLLHQAIAFPRLEWAFRTRLPSLSSAETCHDAALVVAAIANNYLEVLPYIPVTPLFAFCIFVCARTLIIHWRYYCTPQLAPEFDSLVDSLDRICAQWRGHESPQGETASCPLAGLYATRLRKLKQRCIEDKDFRIDPSNYTVDGGDVEETAGGTSNERFPQQLDPSAEQPTSLGYGTTMMESSSLAYHRNQRQPQAEQERMIQPSYQANEAVPSGMDSIEQMFLDSQYINGDRIISLEDNMFELGGGGNTWS